jgi:hypothetical protein
MRKIACSLLLMALYILFISPNGWAGDGGKGSGGGGT